MFIETTDFLDGYSSDEIVFIVISTDNIKRTVVAEINTFLINEITIAVIVVENEKHTTTISSGNTLEIFYNITVFLYELVAFLGIIKQTHITHDKDTLFRISIGRYPQAILFYL